MTFLLATHFQGNTRGIQLPAEKLSSQLSSGLCYIIIQTAIHYIMHVRGSIQCGIVYRRGIVVDWSGSLWIPNEGKNLFLVKCLKHKRYYTVTNSFYFQMETLRQKAD